MGQAEAGWMRDKSLLGILIIYVLEAASALDAADCKACAIRIATHNPCLPFQRALCLFVEDGRVVEVDDLKPAVRCGDNKQLVLGVH